MPLRATADETVRAGPATRKRTFEQITRSQSRSITPTAPPPKRRRANTSAPRITRSGSQMSSRASTPLLHTQRFVGDGLDHRRPAPSAIEAAQAHTTIDLTQDDDDEVENGEADNQRLERTLLSPSLAPTDLSIYLGSITGNADAQSREPRNGSQRPHWRPSRATTEVIDITGDENEATDDGSSDIEFMGSRPLRQPAGHFNRRLPNPLPNLRRANAQSWAADLSGSLGTFIQGIRGHGQNNFAGSGLLDYINRTMAGPAMLPGPEPLNLDTYDNIDGLDDYDDIQMEYGIPPEFMEDHGTNEVAADAYKPPATARNGFTRDIEEEGDVLVCVGCEEELATGDEDDLKAQVWVSKKCGHVYCGECYSRKVSYRRGNDRNRNSAKKRKLTELKECKVDGCDTKLTGKTAMFQIYL